MAGRKPKPTALKVISGNPGKRPLSASEPEYGDLGAPPKALRGRAKKIWLEAGKEWSLVLTAGDRAAVALYCLATAEFEKATKQIEKHGELVASKSGQPVVSPWVAIRDNAAKMRIKLISEFGGTPSSRTRVSAKPQKSTNRFAALG